MELTLKRQPVIINEDVINTTLEQPIELDATLPDYFPDIMKISSCIITPGISQMDINGDRLTLECSAVVAVCYTSDEGEIFRYEGRVPFEKTLDLKNQTHNPVVSADILVSYVNCRAVSGRRLDVRGALSLPINITDTKEDMVLSEIEDANVEVKPINCSVNKVTGQCQKQFTIKEDLELTYGKEPVKRIIRYNCTPIVTDYKLLPGKAVIKGELNLNICYTTESLDKNMQNVNYTLPFSQIIDCHHIDESSKCYINLRVCSITIEPVTDDSGTISKFAMQAVICGEVTGFKAQNISAIEDCYSTKNSLETKTKNIPVSEEAILINEDIHIKETIELPEDTIKICDVWCKSVSVVPVCEGSLAANCKIVVGICVMAPDIQYIERTISAVIPLNIECIHTMPDTVLRMCIKKLTHTDINNNSTEIHIDSLVSGYATIRSFITAVDAVEVDHLAIPAMATNSVVVYYPYPDEPVWDIAKKFGTSMHLIKSNNSLENDYATQGNILIISN